MVIVSTSGCCAALICRARASSSGSLDRVGTRSDISIACRWWGTIIVENMMSARSWSPADAGAVDAAGEPPIIDPSVPM